MSKLRYTHNVAEDMSGDGRPDRPCAEEKEGSVDTEERCVCELEH